MTFFAYVDPGLGLLAWQAVVAAFVGAMFYMRKTRTWLMNCLKKLLPIGRRPERPPAAFSPPRDAVR
jgi:hypothetical protein